MAEKEVPATPTMDGVTKLFRHDCQYECCPQRWSKFPNHEEDQNYLKSSTSNDPIVHRHTFTDLKWVTDSFTIQSPAMRAHLKVALSKYQDFDPELENWTFKPPFNAIVHRWERLNAICEDTTETSSKQAIDQMMEFLRPVLAPAVDSLSRTKKTGKITFDDIWQIFPPGEFVVTTFYGVESVCRVTKYQKVEPSRAPPYWIISLDYVDWNGECCGYISTKVTITFFEGLSHVVSLPVYPLSFNESQAEIRRRIIERGRKFETLRGYHFQTCVGSKILLETESPEERPVAGRVIVDAYAYYQTKNIVKPQMRPLFSPEENYTPGESSSGSITLSGLLVDENESDASETAGPTMTAVKALNKAVTRCEILETLTDDLCLLATPWLRGLDLKTKEWAQFCVSDLSPIVWNDSAFEHLVLPAKEKELAWAFVENKALASNQFDDFVQDKGRGIIILMFGPPGVGKTYTAEAVAERSRVPLYAMSAGMLGTRPKEVEAALDRALDLCKLWNAMLLLDEADIFLGARTNVDLARNELVAVFLTKLEYYQGICFLTTNRISTLDHAFQSRVDLFLPYADLTVQARRQVWENFIKRAGRERFTISDGDLDMLADIKLNGREIKNLIKSANLLSLKDTGKIDLDRLMMLAQNRLRALAVLAE